MHKINGFSALQRAENSSIVASSGGNRISVSVSVLFSEPKIPQSVQCARIPTRHSTFQCSSASRKFLNVKFISYCAQKTKVSVLFSEPKIPQSHLVRRSARMALRFQCSSASRKFLNLDDPRMAIDWLEFQCSSASRKFLNTITVAIPTQDPARFSALQRAENSSIHPGVREHHELHQVSVLFSEPKIPQYSRVLNVGHRISRFSALQRAENSSMPIDRRAALWYYGFSALQRAENSSIWRVLLSHFRLYRFSALQRAENSSMRRRIVRLHDTLRFQCSSASRKFLNSSCANVALSTPRVSVLFSEPKIPQ